MNLNYQALALLLTGNKLDRYRHDHLPVTPNQYSFQVWLFHPGHCLAISGRMGDKLKAIFTSGRSQDAR